MINDRRKFIHSLIFPSLFLIIIWLLKLYEYFLNINFSFLGIYPLKLYGLPGIFTSAFIHGDFNHLISNSLPVLILSVAIFYFYRGVAFKVIFFIWISSGILVWFIGRPSFHIGASGLVYGFAAFVFFSGLLRKDNGLLALSLFVSFIYGSLIWGAFPSDVKISWEAHQMGLISGIVMAIIYRNKGPVKEKYSWEIEEEERLLEIDNPVDLSQKDISINYIWKEEEEKTKEEHEVIKEK